VSFEVVVLGSSGIYPTPDSPTTGFLLRSGDHHVWLDAGTGTFANLQQHTNFFDLDAVVVSHLHIDHFLDVYPLYYALRYSIDCRGPFGMPVYAPEGAEAFLLSLLANGGRGHSDFGGFLDFRTISPDEPVTVGGLEFKFATTLHPIEGMAMSIESEGHKLFYTSDTGYDEDLVEAAKGAQVMIAEATLHEVNPDLVEIHMTAEEAGRMAAKAEVGRLVLTHVQPGLEPDESVARAAREFGGEVVVAEPHMRFPV
jgi:ribonuclease BN (tRNA processing enzyme)